MIISRKEAIKQGLKHYFTGLPCKYGHINKRTTNDYNCVTCNKERTEKYNLLNRKKYLESKIDCYIKKRNTRIKYAKEYRKNNPEKRLVTVAKYRASKLKRTPLWANHYEIKMFYEVANVLSRGGVLFHVDHIIPLQSKKASGFHVENNLQILPWHLNMKKSNKYD